MQQLSTGTTLQGGKYIIERVLGQGGFGITYLAENTILDKKVAIKEFFPKDYCDRDATTSHITVGTQTNVSLVEKLKNRFLKEARNISRLNNPGVVKIHDVFVENNSAYYVMDYIEGESLSDIVKRSGPMDERRAVRYITEVGNALEYIHSMNMTHFDVKPANIMICKSDDKPVLIDFGLSKQYTEAGEATTTGITGASRGFSPIEMYNLDSLAEFSPQSDVYSLGATLLYLITGKTPPDATVLTQQEVEIPSYVSRNISNAIRCSMQLNRRNRCQSIVDFIIKLTDNDETTRLIPTIEENKVISEPEVGEDDDKEPRKPISSKLIAGLIIVGVIFIGIFMINKQKDTPPDNEPIYSDLSDTLAVEVLPTEEETSLAVEESNNNLQDEYFMNHPKTVMNGKECYFLKGYFRDQGIDYPVMLCIINDNWNYRAIYKNVSMGGKIKMKVNFNGNSEITFEGKDGNNRFIIKVEYNSGKWTGNAIDGPKTMYTYLNPTTDTFSW